MKRETSFEIHVLRDGEWEIHAHYLHGDRAATIEQAYSMCGVPEVRAVKVIKEVYMPEAAVSEEFVLFSWDRDDPEKNPLGEAVTGPDNDHAGEAGGPAADGRSDRSAGEQKPRQSLNWRALGEIAKLILIVPASVAAAIVSLGAVAAMLAWPPIGRMVPAATQPAVLFGAAVVSFLVCAVVLLSRSHDMGKTDRPPPAEPADKPPRTAPADQSPRPVPDSGDAESVSGESRTLKDLREAARAVMRDMIDKLAAARRGGSAAMEAADLGYDGDIPGLETPGPDLADGEEPAELGTDDAAPPSFIEERKTQLLDFLAESLRGLEGGLEQVDAFNKFGICLYLAGAAESLAAAHHFDSENIARILCEGVKALGFEPERAEELAATYDKYLTGDRRYMQMFHAGRSAMNLGLSGTAEEAEQLISALRDWNSAESEEQAGGTVAILFTDLVGSTSMTQERGDEAAQEALRGHDQVVRTALERCYGKEIKHTGDGIMAVFTGVSNSLEAAIAIQEGAARHNQENPETTFEVKVGIHAGETIAESNDHFGTTVQMAARIVDICKSGRIATSDIVRGICAGKRYTFNPLGQHDMKGFAEPITLFDVTLSTPARAGKPRRKKTARAGKARKAKSRKAG